MKKLALFLLLVVFAAKPVRIAAAEDGAQLADAVWKASGGENWSKVKAIDFTFAVEKEGKTLVSAEHHWDVTAQTDHVKWKGKDVTVNLADPASDEDAKAAYARWVNDSYWLLAPLKFKERGVQFTAEGRKTVDGAEREVLLLTFDKVGLTPKDQYRLYIDPATKLLASWDYMPEPGQTKHGTWENYQKSGGLTLATEHKMGEIEIKILNLRVTTNE
ncbi:MAG: hypothetical protein H0V54_03315 [Chthoniobacterales bacterium]|nr:hypothetical protein [Chthoniobacterales bacterium]